jgi:DNA-binding winged helix-turn-helix (wHTH) protein
MSGTVLHFGDFRLDPVDRRLFRAGIAVELNARYLDALILLLEADGALVAKDRFMDVVWRGIPVTDGIFRRCRSMATGSSRRSRR